MGRKRLSLIVIIAEITLLLAGVCWADVLAPPVNQTLGFDDTIFNNLVETECRVCHDDTNVVGPDPNVDRHHMLWGMPLPQGQCSVNSNVCLSDTDCDAGICSYTSPAYACTDDSDCPDANIGEVCGEICIGETAVPILDADNNGFPDTVYGCLSCHEEDTSSGNIEFLIERDCLVCHVQAAGEGSVHHLTATAQGTLTNPDDDIGTRFVGDCTPCHGSFVDDIGDGRQIPIYTPSLVTPKPSGGNGLPFNSRENGAGACDYCHDSGTDAATSVQVFANKDIHHNTVVFQSETGVTNDGACLWCHNMSFPDEYVIRTCEGCHGYESLHNIAVDSDDEDTELTVGGENPGYSHVGSNDDCWGCHGFSMASATGTGPIIPYISSSDVLTVTAGTDNAVTLTGSAFTNTTAGTQYTSNVALTATDGSSVTLTPDAITQGSLTVTIPDPIAPGNYDLQAVKGDVTSNPVVLTVKPEVVITDVFCFRFLGIIFIAGSGFGEKPQGTDDYINVVDGDRPLNVIFWADNAIWALGSRCSGTITVNALFGSVAWQQ